MCKIIMVQLNIKVYSIKGQVNLSVNEMNSIVEISEILFVSESSLLSPNSRIFETVESLCHFLLLDLACERGFPCTKMTEAVKEEVGCCFTIPTASTQRGYTVLC